MLKFSANLTFLFTELPFLERIAAAADAGFRGVEYMSPYEWPAETLANHLHRHGLEQVLFNMPAGNWAAGERGLACLPGREAEFRQGVATALRYAEALGCRRINCLAGIKPSSVSRDAAMTTLHRNLDVAVEDCARNGVTLLVEPINFHDMPGYLLNTSADGMAAIGNRSVKLQYDIYHMQRMEGELAATIARLLPVIGHMQLADTPGRHEPGTGEINFDFLLPYIDTLGYDGWIGCEYRPRNSTTSGLGWMARFLTARSPEEPTASPAR